MRLKPQENAAIAKCWLGLLGLLAIISCAECMYEDQVGKIDWSRQYVGRLIDGKFDTVNKQFVVATEQNVLAALSVQTGQLQWRRVLENEERGDIQLFDIFAEPNAVQHAITVTGSSLTLVRSWDLKSGNLGWEWTVNNPHAATGRVQHWYLSGAVLYHAVLESKSSMIKIVSYDVKSGKVVDTRSGPIHSTENCHFAKSVLICTKDGEAVVTSIKNGKAQTLKGSKHTLTIFKDKSALIADGNLIYDLETNTTFTAEVTPTKKFRTTKTVAGHTVLLGSTTLQSAVTISSDTLLSTTSKYPEHLGSAVDIIDTTCKQVNNKLSCQVVLQSENSAVFLHDSDSGENKWLREESLADISALEMVDLPLADVEGAFEKQINHANGDIVGSLIHRLATEFNHVKHLARTIFNAVSTHQTAPVDELTRDAFGLNTIIVVVTSAGKLFGIDNTLGKIHYSINLPNFGRFNNEQDMKIVVQRTSKHFPQPARCSIVAKHKATGKGIVYQFDPIDGTPIDGGVIELDFNIKQLSLLQPRPDFVRGILFLDEHNGVHVYPKEAKEMAHDFYVYVSDTKTGTLTGHHIELIGDRLQAIETWRVNLSGVDNSQKIIKIASKNPNEHVHSQGRVMSDRSVLYKYINPNLVAVVTQSDDSVYKYVLNVHMIDVVSGGVVATITHRRARGPVNIIHSENWLVYTYYNDKVRRSELSSVELYEGNTQANSTVWTSFDAPPLPTIEQQAYIVPASVVTLRETITEKGITSKHVLIGLSSGSVVEMPWHLLDPRRPMMNSNQPREEGVVPYLPELPLSSESVINYNQSISRLKNIYTAPSGLESTCLVVAYGLDFFTVRISPSRTFDLLKDDFDYFTLSTVLLGLTIASFVVKHMSAKKTLKQAWK